MVLRVDSAGGSAFASEMIRRECELVRKAGKPLVVSMGTVAASGGYWISTASDEIWAAPETITGSIGIFGVFPSIHKPLAKYFGIHTDGVGTTRFSDVLRPDRPLDPGAADVIQQSIDNGYQDFLTRVERGAQADPRPGRRDRPRPDLERRGRQAARPRGPARRAAAGDRVGGHAREAREGLPRAGTSRRRRPSASRSLEMLTAGVAAVAGAEAGLDGRGASAPRRSRSPPACAQIQRDVQEVARWNDPRGIYAHCLCGEE